MRTILFDLDETLSDHRHSLEIALLATREHFPILQQFPLPKLLALYQDALHEAFSAYLAKTILPSEKDTLKIKLFFQKCGSRISDEDTAAYLALHEKAYFTDRRATPGAHALLAKLRGSGYKIGVVTNGPEAIQRRKLAEIGLEQMIDSVITSERAGYAKPAQEIFALALSELGAEKFETIMVGDSLLYDIQGAVDFGIRAVQYDPNSSEDAVMIGQTTVPIIKHMDELMRFLEEDRGK